MATISSLLAEHVTLQVRSVDRIFLAGYVPRLQCDGQLVHFLNERAGGTIPSPAILGKIGPSYVASHATGRSRLRRSGRSDSSAVRPPGRDRP